MESQACLACSQPETVHADTAGEGDKTWWSDAVSGIIRLNKKKNKTLPCMLLYFKN